VRKGERDGKLGKKFAGKDGKSNLSVIMVFVGVSFPGKAVTGGLSL